MCVHILSPKKIFFHSSALTHSSHKKTRLSQASYKVVAYKQ